MSANNRWNDSSYLIHFGILGQKWGVRRFQNEDGTLTEEGRKRYLKNFEDAERKADEDLKRAQSQLADIDKNGWNARSAFGRDFVKQMRDEGMLNDENLKLFRETFEEDATKALADKKAARAGRDLINNYQNVTYDDILNQASKLDKEHKNLTEYDSTRIDKYKNSIESIGKELGLERKKQPNNDNEKTKIKISYDKDDLARWEKVPEKQLRGYVKELLNDIPDKSVRAEIKEMLDNYPPAMQMTILGSLISGNIN